MEVLTASSTAYSYYPDVKISEVCKAFNVLSFRKRFGCKRARPLPCLILLDRFVAIGGCMPGRNKSNPCPQAWAHSPVPQNN